MKPVEGQYVLTAAEMRAAEQRAIDMDGDTVSSLMDRAGQKLAEGVRRLASVDEILIMCGPGNNGGDGYVAARLLRDWGLPVRVAALADPTTDAARAVRAAWAGAVEPLLDAAPAPAPVLVDAVFGTGLSRPLDARLAEALAQLVREAKLTIAVDLPSGVATDTGAALGDPLHADVTLALGALKPAHLLSPAAEYCGMVRVLDIGLGARVGGMVSVPQRPVLDPPGASSHKYSRGMVAIVVGAMPGAAELSAQAALHAGAGYALLLGETGTTAPHAVVRRPFASDALADSRIGAIVIGPGLGRDRDAKLRLDAALDASAALIVDGDALHLLDARRLDLIRKRAAVTILTPHAGEFDALFGKSDASRISRAQAAAEASGAIVVFKGSSTVIAAPGGATRITPPGNPWLSTAGTGDVLTGAIAALLAGNPHRAAIDMAAAGVWLHAEASRRLGTAFLADDLARDLSAARASV